MRVYCLIRRILVFYSINIEEYIIIIRQYFGIEKYSFCMTLRRYKILDLVYMALVDEEIGD